METRSSKLKQTFWQQQIRSWHSSGMSQKDYCRHHALALSTFTYWKRKIEKSESETVTFFPLTTTATNKQGGEAGLLLHVGNNRFVVDIRDDFSAHALKKLVLTLEQL